MNDADVHSSLLSAATGQSRRRPYGVGFSAAICSYVILLFLYAATVIFLLYAVHLRLVWGNEPLISTGDVPYYNRGDADPDFSAAAANVNTFDWFVFASDALLVLVPVYSLVAMTFGLLCGLSGLAATGAPLFVALIALWQTFKSVYFTLYFFSLFGLKCAAYPLCQNRDPSIAVGSPDTLFTVELFTTYALTLATYFVATLPSVYRSAQRRTLVIGARYADAAASKNIDFSRNLHLLDDEDRFSVSGQQSGRRLQDADSDVESGRSRSRSNKRVSRSRSAKRAASAIHTDSSADDMQSDNGISAHIPDVFD